MYLSIYTSICIHIMHILRIHTGRYRVPRRALYRIDKTVGRSWRSAGDLRALHGRLRRYEMECMPLLTRV